MSHENLHKATDWCRKTGLLRLDVRYYTDSKQFAVRVVPLAGGITHSLRSKQGINLEALCEEILPLAQKDFIQREASLKREHSAWVRKTRISEKEVMRDIMSMHHTAEDF